MPNWGHVLNEIQRETDGPGSDSAADKVRTKYLMALHKHVERNIICYYSGWLSKPKIEGIDISDEDKNGLMLCVHGLDRSKGLDLVLHTPGGSVATTASLVDYLRQMFGTDVRAFVPQIAMSAGTMIACSCKEIYMGKHSNLGPVDPSINGIAAHAVVEELKTAYAEIIQDNKRAFIWNPILSRYTPGFLQQCHWAIQAAKEFVESVLKDNMFADLPPDERDTVVSRIVDRLSDLSTNKGHDKHVHSKECSDLGLKIKMLEETGSKELQDLVLTVHHCFMYTLANTAAFKIIENHRGRRYVKLQQQQLMFVPHGLPGGPPQKGAAQ
jgi:hypothetical protein